MTLTLKFPESSFWLYTFCILWHWAFFDGGVLHPLMSQSHKNVNISNIMRRRLGGWEGPSSSSQLIADYLHEVLWLGPTRFKLQWSGEKCLVSFSLKDKSDFKQQIVSWWSLLVHARMSFSIIMLRSKQAK